MLEIKSHTAVFTTWRAPQDIAVPLAPRRIVDFGHDALDVGNGFIPTIVKTHRIHNHPEVTKMGE